MHVLTPLAAALAVGLADRAADRAARLAHPAFAVRAAAARDLDALDGAALPALRRVAAASPDAEAARRAADLIDRITARAENARLTAPVPVELNLARAPVADVFAAIEKQTGCRFVAHTATQEAVRGRRVTVRTDGPVPFWQAVEAACAAAGLQVSDAQPTRRPSAGYYGGRGGYYSSPPSFVPENFGPLAPDPGPDPFRPVAPIALEPRTAAADRPTWRGNAVRVRVADLPDEARSAFAPDTLPLLLTVAGEARVAWVRTTGVRVAKATAPGGVRLVPDLVEPVGEGGLKWFRTEALAQFPAGRLLAVLREDDPVQVWVPADPAHAVLRLTSERPGLTRLDEISGVVTGIARVAPEELAAVPLSADAPASADGRFDVRLKALAVETAEGGYVVEATVSFPALRMIPAGGAGRDQWLAEAAVGLGRRAMRPRESRVGIGEDGRVVEGLIVADAAGAAFDLSAGWMVSAATRRGDDAMLQRTVRLTVKPTAATAGPPKRLAFWASAERPVAAAFTLSNVPVAAGTRWK